MARRIAARVGRFINDYETELGIAAVLVLIGIGALNFARAVGAFDVL